MYQVLEEPSENKAYTVVRPQQLLKTDQAMELNILKQFTFSSELQVL